MIFEKTLLKKTCVLIFSTNVSQTFLILNSVHQDTAINVHRSSYEVPVILMRERKV